MVKQTASDEDLREGLLRAGNIKGYGFKTGSLGLLYTLLFRHPIWCLLSGDTASFPPAGTTLNTFGRHTNLYRMLLDMRLLQEDMVDWYTSVRDLVPNPEV